MSDQSVRHRTIELRTYLISAGHEQTFHGYMINDVVPMLQEAGVEVVGYIPSLTGPAGVLIRSFDDEAHRRTAKAAFYSSPQWVDGPKEAVESLLAQLIDVVTVLPEDAVAALAQSNWS